MAPDNTTLEIIADLEKLASLLEAYDIKYASLSSAIENENDADVWNFLTSNSLWGGSGSIADQALLEIPDARDKLEKILIRLGKAQQALGKVNVRTEMWVSFFESRQSQ